MTSPTRTRLLAVLFDFDGVIVNSEPLHCRSYLETAAAMGVPLTEAQYYAELIGFDDRGAIAHLYRRAGRALDDETFGAFLRRKTQRVLELVRDGEYQALPGVVALLDALARRDVATGICSGALRHEIDGMLAGVRLRERFAVITSAEDVEVGKPDPGGYLLTARRLSEKIGRAIGPGACLVIEDAPTVAVRAREAGFHVLGVTTTYGRDRWPIDIPTVPSLEPHVVSGAVPQLQPG